MATLCHSVAWKWEQKMKYAILLSFAFIFASCASNYGRIKNTLGTDEALVQLGKEKYLSGDKLTVLHRECRNLKKRTGISISCSNNPVGLAEVIEVRTNTNEVVIKADKQTPLNSGYLTEKVRQ